MTTQDRAGDGTVAAVLRLTELTGKVERGDARIGELARDCAAAAGQVTALRRALGTLTGRADEIERRLADVTAVLNRMSAQIGTLTAPPEQQQPDSDGDGEYKVNPGPPWWNPADQRCRDTTARLADWVSEVYRPVYGYLAELLAPCWQHHPLCLAYLDAVHEAWCLLYLSPRDPKMVFAQLDWLNRSLLQAADVMANETKPCRDRGSHRDPGQDPARAGAPWLNARR